MNNKEAFQGLIQRRKKIYLDLREIQSNTEFSVEEIAKDLGSLNTLTEAMRVVITNAKVIFHAYTDKRILIELETLYMEMLFREFDLQGHLHDTEAELREIESKLVTMGPPKEL